MNTRAASASRTSTTCTPLLYPYNPATPFDLSSRSVATAYTNACAHLYKPRYVQVQTFPSFIVNIHIHANKVKCNTVTYHGILSIHTRGNINRNILIEYQSISSINIADAFAARTDYCAIQNLRPSMSLSPNYSPELFVIMSLIKHKTYLPEKTASQSSNFSRRSSSLPLSNFQFYLSTKSRAFLRQHTTTSSPKSTPSTPICSCSLVNLLASLATHNRSSTRSPCTAASINRPFGIHGSSLIPMILNTDLSTSARTS